MNYTNQEINHIIYHNRSSNLISNFLPKFNIKDIIDQENKLTYCREIYTDTSISNEVEIEKIDLKIDSDDIIFEKKDINLLTDFILDLDIKNTKEYDYLINRGFNDETILKYNFKPLSKINDKKILDIIGATTHPILNNIFGNGISGGGILLPLIKDNILENIAIRRIDDSNKMKYTLAIPDISLWGEYKIIKNKEIWLTEGIFDRIAMIENGFSNVLTASTPGLSIIHLMKILKMNPIRINVWSDKDRTGLRHSLIIKKFFSLNQIPVEIYISEESKDPFEHFNNGYTMDDIYPINIGLNDLKIYTENINKNFIEYLNNRKY